MSNRVALVSLETEILELLWSAIALRTMLLSPAQGDPQILEALVR